ncbi:hypothetical protein SAMD00023353_3200750 [Rosellinia necatrix]|uniref:Uncharacterized protein n=1 Tax=Rosellinia necatrix TaxID=77044 RepID=A0A1W2TIM6_ROSNE|nr:hypothetical protein SAMD00023353_3200750 [Rosellinia necatrix]
MKKVYEVSDEKALEQWLASTFIVSAAANSEELYSSVTPIKQATLYYVPNSSELVFCAHHHTIDGVGVLLFWHNFLEALSSPVQDIKFGDETTRLVPTIERVLGYPEKPSQELRDKATALFMSWAGSILGIGPISQVGAAPSGKCQNSELVFIQGVTTAIAAVCVGKNISVSAAVHAAYIQAIAKHADPNSKLSEYVTATQFNLRPYLSEPYNSSKYAASVFYTPLPYKADLPMSFWDLTKPLTEYYRTSFKGNPEMLEVKGQFTRALCAAVETPEFLANPVPKDALVSSLGTVKRYVQREYDTDVKVKDIKVGVDIVMGMSMFFYYTYPWSLNGGMAIKEKLCGNSASDADQLRHAGAAFGFVHQTRTNSFFISTK